MRFVSRSSKLGVLFGMDRAGSQGGNESLTYTAPKQPKKKGLRTVKYEHLCTCMLFLRLQYVVYNNVYAIKIAHVFPPLLHNCKHSSLSCNFFLFNSSNKVVREFHCFSSLLHSSIWYNIIPYIKVFLLCLY